MILKINTRVGAVSALCGKGCCMSQCFMENSFCVLERAFADPSTSENAQSNLEPFIHGVLNITLITLSSVLPLYFLM